MYTYSMCMVNRQENLSKWLILRFGISHRSTWVLVKKVCPKSLLNILLFYNSFCIKGKLWSFKNNCCNWSGNALSVFAKNKPITFRFRLTPEKFFGLCVAEQGAEEGVAKTCHFFACTGCLKSIAKLIESLEFLPWPSLPGCQWWLSCLNHCLKLSKPLKSDF